ncbi:MAG: AIPR family protein [Nitrospira sp.]
MNLRQQIVQERIAEIGTLMGLPSDQAFLRLAQHLITGQSIHAFDQTDVTDGGQDKQIDAITIEEGTNQATVYILQVKNTESFSSNSIIQIRNGLNWLFNKPRADIKTLSNTAFRDKIAEYRSLQGSIGPSNIRIVVRYATNGLTSQISQECIQERKAILDEYDNGTFSEFSFLVIGADELVGLINAQERQHKQIDADLRIQYDANTPSLIKYYSGDLKGLVCSASAREVARIVNADKEGSIFDLNLRRYLGGSGAVNKDIYETAINPDSSYQFWFLNNGITVVCDQFDAVTDPDNPHIKIKNLQIVNGCQTATTLATAQKHGNLAADVRVVVRIYETKEKDLVDKIVLTTNNQNRITNRDLRANDTIQLDMERAFSIYGYHYERKPRQYDNLSIPSSKIIANESVGQAYLSVVLKKPSDARGRKYKVWEEYYTQIFSGHVVEPHIISVLAVSKASEWVRLKGFTSSSDDVKRTLAKKGILHIARIAMYDWRASDNWSNVLDLKAQLQEIQVDPSALEGHLQKAIEILEWLIGSDPHYVADIDAALKSYTLDEKIDKSLHAT